MRTKAEVIEVVKGIIEEVLNEKVSKKEATEIVVKFSEAVKNDLLKGNEVVIPEVGKFKVVKTNARKARNPQTGETIQVPAGKKIKFKPAAKLKEEVKKS